MLSHDYEDGINKKQNEDAIQLNGMHKIKLCPGRMEDSPLCAGREKDIAVRETNQNSFFSYNKRSEM